MTIKVALYTSKNNRMHRGIFSVIIRNDAYKKQ